MEKVLEGLVFMHVFNHLEDTNFFTPHQKFQSMAIKRILKINNLLTELFNFQNSFNCY